MSSPMDQENSETENDISNIYEREIWTFMKDTIISLLSSLDSEEITESTEQSLHQLLESLLTRFNSLNILVPPMTNGPVHEDVQQRYTAFTTWLFGAMFHLINVPVNLESLKKVIEIQVCMVRILSRLNLEMHQLVTTEYLDIFQELVNFHKQHRAVKELKLIKFVFYQDVISYLKLEPFSVIVKYEDIPLFQTSIIKIIAESDVSTWPKSRLKNQLLDILVYSQPIVKISALQICVEMFDYNLLNIRDKENMILYATEIVKSLSNWNEKGIVTSSTCQQHASTFKDLLMLVDDSRYISFYFEILSALINNTLDYKQFEIEACQKIESHLIKYPRLYKEIEINKFSSFFNNSQQFIKIIISFISYEIGNHSIDGNSNDLAQYSKIWSVLKNHFYNNLQHEKYEETINFLHLANSLDFWFFQNNISLYLLKNDVENIKLHFLKVLAFNNYQHNKLIFENFTQLISLREVNKNEIQNILSLPWLALNMLPSEITKNHIANSKSLDSITKVKCINSICKYGEGRDRLNLFSMCVSGCDIELGVASVMNCPFLLTNKDIEFDGIMEKILIPAYNTQKLSIHEALAAVIGQLACLVSENGRIIRDSKNPDKWIVKCDYCDIKTEKMHNNSPKVVSAKFENYFKSLFELFKSNSKKIRLNLSKNMIKLSCHVKYFNSNESALKWILYIRDKDEEIRKNFGDSIGFILNNRIRSSISNKSFQDDTPVDLIEFVKIIMDNLVSVFNESLETSNQSLHQTLIITAKNAACISSHLTEQRALNIFILTILHVKSTPLAVALATDAYREVALYNKISLKTLYVRYKRDIMKLMMALAVHNRINFDYNMSTTIHRVAKCMGFQGSRQLMRRDGQHAICFLLSEVVKHCKAITLFHDIAELINGDEQEMFKSYFPHICARVFLFEDVAIGIQIFKLVSKITKINIPDLTAKYFTIIINELMLHFHSQKDKVLKHLQFLSKYDNQKKASFKSPNEIAQYLSSVLHGMLVTFDANLGPNCEEIMQKHTLASLAEVIRFMGPSYMSQYKYKILATLRTAIGFTRPGFRKLACNAWDAFLKNTTIKEIGPLLATICVSLIPLLETNPRETNAMLVFLLIKNMEVLQEHIQDLFFINDLKISPDISTRVISCIKQSKPKTVEENIKLWIKRIDHQTDEVKLKALLYLQQYFAKNRSKINDMILSDVNVHPLIVELLNVLMAGCQDKNEAICIASGDCIGELGAIEPSLLPRRIISREDTKFISEMNQEFAHGLFYELVNDYQSQNTTQSMDCFSLAIQEILRSYEISPGGKNCQLWNELPSKIQRMIFPMLTSHYTTTSSNTDVEFPTPIYGSESGSTYEMWALNWTASMLKTIKNTVISNVLNACRPAFKRNVKIMNFCIPYIVNYVIIHGSSKEVQKLTSEMLAVITINEKLHVDLELDRNRPLRAQIDNTTNNARVSDEVRRVRCLQVIFSTLDYLQRWLREKRKPHDEQYKKVEKFCDSFPKLLLAQGCYQSHEYHRALIYLEQHMTSSKKGLSESLEGGLLAKIYTQLEEPDGVSGILVSQDKCPTLQQLVLAHEVNGQLQDAATCYERLLQNTLPEPKYLQGIIQCYLGLDQPYTAMNITKGILDDRPELETLICDSEPFWQLAHFGKIGVNKNNVKLNLLQNLKTSVKPDFLSIKKKLVSLLIASSRPGAYEQSYSYIMKLHVVNEFEKACAIMLEDFENLPSVFEEWEARDKLINASRGAEFVLGMRRAILDLAVKLKSNKNDGNNLIKEQIGKLWLKSAKIARKAGLYQQAYMHTLSATDTCPPRDLCIEQAQLYWQKGALEDALITLKRCLTMFFKPVSEYKKQSTYSTEKKQCAKAKLLWAKYNDETLNLEASGNILNYKEAHEVFKTWEKSCIALARYYEILLDKMTDDEQMTGPGKEMQVHIVNCYGKSLNCGCKYIHQSLPRMLTVWLNYTSRANPKIISNPECAVAKSSSQMTKIVEVYLERVPIFVWLTAFSQLVSRICHPNREVQNTLFTIIVKSIKAFPQQCLWMMASVFNSSYPARQKSCKEILNRDALKSKEMQNLISCFHKFWERLIELSNRHIPDGVSNTTVSVLSRSLPKLLADDNFGPIMMPTSKFRQLHLPMKGALEENYNPFTAKYVKIVGIDEVVLVMPSLQRPRRISLRGNDGNSYLFMCKPKDDLRRDFRLMEFNDIVNNNLQKDPEARRRRLSIRTYSVVPLNEECGLIEWVPNLIGYRNILMNIYKERNILMSMKEIRSMTCALKDPIEKKRQVFLEKLVPRHPPVLGDWFQFSFPDPYGWYEARTAYIRTTAVMSMVGYILGLGDRHGENILLDSKCGDLIHVDFNCLFNRGESLEYPERVPFRLTHNMVEAMGPLKYEGSFRQSCRTTMKVLREQSSTLLSILKPFLYDPLVTWNKNQVSTAGEKTNEKAVEHIKNIEDRLKGRVANRGKKFESLTLFLSVEGQVNHLILESTNVDNLCQMYIGWGPYL